MARKDMSDEEFEARRAAYLIGIVDTITKHGLAIQGVFRGEDDPQTEPNFHYTVGLAAIDKPEIIAFGLPMNVGHAILNALGFAILHSGFEVEAGDEISEVVADYTVKMINVDNSWEHLTVANQLYGNPDGVLPALQMVFPDEDGLFPWEPGCDVDWQPLLGDVPADWRDVVMPEREA